MEVGGQVTLSTLSNKHRWKVNPSLERGLCCKSRMMKARKFLWSQTSILFRISISAMQWSSENELLKKNTLEFHTVQDFNIIDHNNRINKSTIYQCTNRRSSKATDIWRKTSSRNAPSLTSWNSSLWAGEKDWSWNEREEGRGHSITTKSWREGPALLPPIEDEEWLELKWLSWHYTSQNQI
jgi:hypothetical protein